MGAFSLIVVINLLNRYMAHLDNLFAAHLEKFSTSGATVENPESRVLTDSSKVTSKKKDINVRKTSKNLKCLPQFDSDFETELSEGYKLDVGEGEQQHAEVEEEESAGWKEPSVGTSLVLKIESKVENGFRLRRRLGVSEDTCLFELPFYLCKHE